MNAPTYTLPRRDYRFMTAAEKEHDRAYEAAMRAFSDARSDEMQLLGESITDDISDLIDIFAHYFKTGDRAYAGHLLGRLLDRHAERVAESEAQRACETVPENSL